jgi:hypothetical protein
MRLWTQLQIQILLNNRTKYPAIQTRVTHYRALRNCGNTQTHRQSYHRSLLSPLQFTLLAFIIAFPDLPLLARCFVRLRMTQNPIRAKTYDTPVRHFRTLSPTKRTTPSVFSFVHRRKAAS